MLKLTDTGERKKIFMNMSTKRIVLVGLFCAVAYIAMVMIHLNLVPAAPFLTYDPKDAVIVIAGFLLGPVYTVIISVIVAFLEMVTVSSSGIIGFIMQIIATASYAVTASVIYQKHRTKANALTGLIAGTVAMTIMMILWNYLITPIYMGVDRSVVAGMIATAFLPFNLLKGLVNSVIAFLIYKPIANALRKTGAIPPRK